MGHAIHNNGFFFFGGSGQSDGNNVGYPVVGRERVGAIYGPFQTETQGKAMNVFALA